MFSRKFLKLPTIKGDFIYVRKNAIIKVWKENNNSTAIMCSSGSTEIIKMSIDSMMKKLNF